MQLDLYNLNFRFAVEHLDPDIGTVEVYAVDYPYRQEKTSKRIEMIDCEEFEREGGLDIPGL